MDIGTSRAKPEFAVLKFKTAKEYAVFWNALYFFKIKVVNDHTGSVYRADGKTKISESAPWVRGFVNTFLRIHLSKEHPYALGLLHITAKKIAGNYPTITLPQAMRVLKALKTWEILAQEEEKNR